MKNIKKLLTTVILSITITLHGMKAGQEGNGVITRKGTADKIANLVGFVKNSNLSKVAANHPRVTKNIAIGAGVATVGTFAYKRGLFSKVWSTAKNFVKKHPYGTAAGAAITAASLGTLVYFADRGSFHRHNAVNSIVSGVKHGCRFIDYVCSKVSVGLLSGVVSASLVEKNSRQCEQKTLNAQKVAQEVAQRMFDVAVSKRLEGNDSNYAVSAVREVYAEGVVGNLSAGEINEQLGLLGSKKANMNNALFQKAISDLSAILALA